MYLYELLNVFVWFAKCICMENSLYLFPWRISLGASTGIGVIMYLYELLNVFVWFAKCICMIFLMYLYEWKMFFIFSPEEFYLGQTRVSASPERWLSSVCYTEKNTGWCWKKRIFWRKKEYFEGKKKKKSTQNGSHPSVTQNTREYFEIKYTKYKYKKIYKIQNGFHPPVTQNRSFANVSYSLLVNCY